MATRVRIFAVCLHRCLSCLMMHTFAAARCSSIFCSRIFPICYGGKKRAQFTCFFHCYSASAFRSIEFVPLFDTLKITEKVSFTITSEASYVCIWSRQKFIKNVLENLKLAVKQCYQKSHFQ